MMGCGIGIEAGETGKQERMDAFLDDTLRQIDRRIFSAGILYAMMIGLIDGVVIPGWVLPLYLGKAACWIVLPAAVTFKKRRNAPDGEDQTGSP